MTITVRSIKRHNHHHYQSCVSSSHRIIIILLKFYNWKPQRNYFSREFSPCRFSNFLDNTSHACGSGQAEGVSISHSSGGCHCHPLQCLHEDYIYLQSNESVDTSLAVAGSTSTLSPMRRVSKEFLTYRRYDTELASTARPSASMLTLAITTIIQFH